MKKEEQEMEVIVYGEIDLRKIPKEIFDAFIAALEEDICNVKKEEKENQRYKLKKGAYCYHGIQLQRQYQFRVSVYSRYVAQQHQAERHRI